MILLMYLLTLFMYYLHLSAVFITTVLCKVGLAAPSRLLLGCVDLLEGQYREVADECIHGERVKANMVASLAERVDLSILKCDVCHMESILLHLMANIQLHHTLHEYNRHLRDNRNRKNRKTVKFCHK